MSYVTQDKSDKSVLREIALEQFGEVVRTISQLGASVQTQPFMITIDNQRYETQPFRWNNQTYVRLRCKSEGLDYAQTEALAESLQEYGVKMVERYEADVAADNLVFEMMSKPGEAAYVRGRMSKLGEQTSTCGESEKEPSATCLVHFVAGGTGVVERMWGSHANKLVFFEYVDIAASERREQEAIDHRKRAAGDGTLIEVLDVLDSEFCEEWNYKAELKLLKEKEEKINKTLKEDDERKEINKTLKEDERKEELNPKARMLLWKELGAVCREQIRIEMLCSWRDDVGTLDFLMNARQLKANQSKVLQISPLEYVKDIDSYASDVEDAHLRSDLNLTQTLDRTVKKFEDTSKQLKDTIKQKNDTVKELERLKNVQRKAEAEQLKGVQRKADALAAAREDANEQQDGASEDKPEE